jgi:RNA 2',3'-cyclic 3'-phosphodiesterase
MKRIFIAIDIPAALRSRIGLYSESLKQELPVKEIRWESAEKMHITLRFLGDADERGVSNAIAATERAAENASDFELIAEGTGAFPSVARARVFWGGVSDPGRRANHFHGLLEKELAIAGFERETRRFSPHITIARLKNQTLGARIAAMGQEKQFDPATVKVSEVAIYESILTSSGSYYFLIRRVPLGATRIGKQT